MSDLLVSLIEGIAGAVAGARERREAAAAALVGAPQSQDPRLQIRQARQPQSIAPPTPPQPATTPARPAAEFVTTTKAIDLTGIFETPDRVVHALVASELLGPPLALRRQNPWDVPGVQ